MTDETREVGQAYAALLAASLGAFTLGILACAADASKPFAGLLNIYNPTGPLSGVSTGAVVVWLGSWILLNRRWKDQSVAVGRVGAIALTLLGLGLLLTFPPAMDLLTGK